MSSSRTVNLENAADVILEYLADYAAEVGAEIDFLAETTAEEILADVIEDSPVRGGEYAEGWRHRKEMEGAKVRHRIFNVSKPQLTHLLEFGHVTRLGTGRATVTDGKKEIAEPRAHILPAYERHVPQFYENVKQIIQGR